MEAYEKEEILHDRLVEAINHISMEYNLTYIQIIGILNILQAEFTNDFFNPEDEDNE